MKRFFSFFIVIGFILLIITAGSSDMGMLSLPAVFQRASVSICFVAFGYFGGRFAEYRKARRYQKMQFYRIEQIPVHTSKLEGIHKTAS